jgi:hypothetical protein
VKALEAGSNVVVTKDHASRISFMDKEFWLEDLLSECSALQVAPTNEPITTLSGRIPKLGHQVCFFL